MIQASIRQSRSPRTEQLQRCLKLTMLEKQIWMKAATTRRKRKRATMFVAVFIPNVRLVLMLRNRIWRSFSTSIQTLRPQYIISCECCRVRDAADS